jgi:Fuc2NAc and GlcNAc transferase
LGWWDDHSNLPARLRLPLQLALVGVACVAISLPDQLVVMGAWSFPVSIWWLVPVAILGGGWMVNLTNFMDGIDGIAATQGVIGSLGLSLLLPPEATEFCLLLEACGAACLGFLVWNRPPAKIFMGDVGSTALGLVFAIGILGGISYGVALEELLMPLAPFIADSTCTLVRRFWHGERLSQAHRSHLYQRLAKYWGKHLTATALYGGLALLGTALSLMTHHGLLPPLFGLVLWLLPWTMLVLYGRHSCPVIPG